MHISHKIVIIINIAAILLGYAYFSEAGVGGIRLASTTPDTPVIECPVKITPEAFEGWGHTIKASDETSVTKEFFGPEECPINWVVALYAKGMERPVMYAYQKNDGRHVHVLDNEIDTYIKLPVRTVTKK